MPRYFLSLEDGIGVTSADAAEDFADDDAAMHHASRVAGDLSGSTIAQGKSSVVVRDATAREVGRVPLLKVIR